MNPGSKSQANLSDYNLHTLGWKSFQDLCIAIASEVLRRPVQTFLPSKDGGRDGAFIGTWNESSDNSILKSTIQCKFTSKNSVNITASSLNGELSKIKKLVENGLAEEYILITNFGVSADAEMEIIKQVKLAGVKQCRVFGRDWITSEIRSRPKLRMMVPRLYGLGDLSQIIDERAYAQARQILSSMGDDLACFVTTKAHRQSVIAVRDHNFVLLLGDPASGKSTIGASLAIGSLDDGAFGAIKINSPDQFDKHWNPDEPNQFFWIDDAFGPTQYKRSLVDGWNARLRDLRAAIKGGARVLMTSRNYIWNSAQKDLKSSDFPLFKESQVIIDVQSLEKHEKAQILYNHIKLGTQTKSFRKNIKPFLAEIAANSSFLPETARRLGSPFFTKNLVMYEPTIRNFVEKPVEFLVDILRGLDEGTEAAVAIVFLHGTFGVSSPVQQSPALELVLRLTGASSAALIRSLEALQGSLTLLSDTDRGPSWVFKHPTIADAYSLFLSTSPEKIDIYLQGAKIERLLNEVACYNTLQYGSYIKLPPTSYDLLIDRLEQNRNSEKSILSFLADRSDKEFMRKYMSRNPRLLDIYNEINSDLSYNLEARVISKIHEFGMLPEAIRIKAVQVIRKASTTWADSAVFENEHLQVLFTKPEFNSFVQSFDSIVVRPYETDPLAWSDTIISDNAVGVLRSYQESLMAYNRFRSRRRKGVSRIRAMIDRLEDGIRELEHNINSYEGGNDFADQKPGLDVEIRTIFDDVDQ